jgi:SAM-dependent methyltransferase
MLPELLTSPAEAREHDLSAPQYAEAYEEMEHYNQAAAAEARQIQESEAYNILRPIIESCTQGPSTFPEPKKVWLDGPYDCVAQEEAYDSFGSCEGKTALQLGGKGIHAVKFLLAGAQESWLLTPMIGEALCAVELARAAGVVEGIRPVLGVGEEFPFADGTLDVVYSGGCVHHTDTTKFFPECARVLRQGGKFGATDPWKAPLYTLGVKIFGKREPNVFCRPLTSERVAPMFAAFSTARISHHGAVLRYPLLAFSKLGIGTSLPAARRLIKADDALCSLIPGLRRFGSCVALLAEK